MHKTIYIFSLIVAFFISFKALSLTSSPYLIANSAMLLHDYQSAHIYYQNIENKNMSLNDLEKKLVALINNDNLNMATKIAKKILNKNKSIKEAWLVLLTHAYINNYSDYLKEFNKIKNNYDLKIVELVFMDNNQLYKNQNIIAQSFFSIAYNGLSDDSSIIQNYDYLLFYLSLSSLIDKDFEEAYFYSALLYQQLNYFQKAEQLFKKINNNHPLYLESQKNIAINKSLQNNFFEAEKNLLLLIKSNSKNNDLLITLADLYKKNLRYEDAIKYYSKVLIDNNLENSLKWRLFYMLGICYERTSKWSLAEENFLKSLEINPESPQVLNYLAYGWIERNIFIDRSLDMLKKAYKKNPDSHYILDSLAWAYYKKNDLSMASQLMEQVLDMAPGEAVSIDHLGDIYLAMNRKREAIFMWRQAIDLANPGDLNIEEVLKKIEKYNAG